MKEYFSTFQTGFSQVVKEALQDSLQKLKLGQMYDGLVIYTTETSIETVKKLRFINNTFLLINQFDNQSIDEVLEQIITNKNLKSLKQITIPNRYSSFRVVVTLENQMVSVDNRKLKKLEDIINQVTGLKVNRNNPSIEFWILKRSEGIGLFGMRLTRHPDYTTSLPKGSLRPELANILCLISQPSSEDVFLDPFSGSGAIPIERALGFPFQKVIASDSNPEMVKLTKKMAGKAKTKITVRQWDALQLNELEDNSIDKIVTDPPWGHYFDEITNAKNFYGKVLISFYRVVKPQGIIVILTAQKQALEEILVEHGDKFRLLEKYDTLISGRKAGVYKVAVFKS